MMSIKQPLCSVTNKTKDSIRDRDYTSMRVTIILQIRGVVAHATKNIRLLL